MVILAATLASLASNNRPRRALGAGALLYLGYVFWIGGDFMSGRFFSAALVLGVGLLATLEVKRPMTYVWVAMVVLLSGFTSPHPPFVQDTRIGQERRAVFVYKGQVTDERAYYYPRTGLLDPTKFYITRRFAPPASWVADPADNEVRLLNDLGIKGYGAGPSVHVLDAYALSDPLLARLPAVPQWSTIGHAPRLIPAGYIETLASGENMIVDPSLALYYDRLHLVVSGELFDAQRLMEIVKLNLGAFDYLLEEYAARGAEH
jgi:arabinofuranosyltransferase